MTIWCYGQSKILFKKPVSQILLISKLRFVKASSNFGTFPNRKESSRPIKNNLDHTLSPSSMQSPFTYNSFHPSRPCNLFCLPSQLKLFHFTAHRLNYTTLSRPCNLYCLINLTMPCFFKRFPPSNLTFSSKQSKSSPPVPTLVYQIKLLPHSPLRQLPFFYINSIVHTIDKDLLF